jgi:DUF2075 family protein/SOS-response transcriptional repressor LexA
MRLYEGSLGQFRDDVVRNVLADKLSEAFRGYYRRPAPMSEVGAWQQSLNFLKNSFDVAALDQQQVIVEYELPYSSRRIDVLLFGRSTGGDDGIVLVELKQWSNDGVADAEAEGNVRVRFAHGMKEVAHPSWQVEGYHYDLQDFLQVFQDEPAPELSSCAYCHNYARLKEPKVLFEKKFGAGLKKFPLFAKEDVEALGKYLQERISAGPGLEVFNRFVRSTVRPSKKLLEHTGEMINKQQIFTLIDEQIAAYNAIMHKAKHLTKLRQKSVVIVKGGPGTGKSVIALEVMGELLRMKKTVIHATGSSAFTNTLRKIVGPRAKGLFKFFNSFVDGPDEGFDVLIADEAHRIRESSNSRYTPRARRTKVPQIDELLRAARLSVFFIDEKQIVRPNEVGSIQLIREGAAKFGVKAEYIAEFELQTQFRCSGSDAFLQWLDNALGIRPAQAPSFDSKMEFKIFDSAPAMMNEIRARNREKKNCARIVAGFCWPWSDPKPDGTLVNDVVIGDFQMPWERKDQFWKWATDDSGMEQVGTVYTAQGFEFDYIAVIFGNDLVYDLVEEDWKAVPENSHDKQVKRSNPKLREHLASVYRVLLSRAHKGVYVYFMDRGTERFFRSQIEAATTGQRAATVVPLRPEPTAAIVLKDLEERYKFLRLDDTRVKTEAYKTLLPVYSLRAAAGYFGAGTSVEPEGWVDASSVGRLDEKMFVARVVGRSMEPAIHDGDLCVFRARPPGSRQGKVVLVQYRGPWDPETGGAFTVKRYRSRKLLQEDDTWQHEEITLEPLNKDFDPIVLTAKEEGDVVVVAEFIKPFR